MKTIILSILLYGVVVTIPNNFVCMKKIEKNGMQVQWKHQGGQLDVEIFAPTKGWIAIGFNKKNALQGTNLIMGKITDEQVFEALETFQDEHRKILMTHLRDLLLKLHGNDILISEAVKELAGITKSVHNLKKHLQDNAKN